MRAEQPAAQRGLYHLTGTTLNLLGEDVSNNFESIFAKDEDLSWQVYVPESYLPEKPAGVVVYISPSNSGELPR